MQSLAVGGFSEAAVKAVLHGPRTVDFRYDLLDVDGSLLGPLVNVEGGSIQHGGFDDIPRTAKINISGDVSAINFGRHRVRPWMRVEITPGQWAEWPLGLFLMSTPGRAAWENNSGRSVECYDQTSILRQDLLPTRTTVPAGTVILSAISSQLTDAGITSISAEPNSSTMPIDRDWPPGTSRYEIIQDLREMINYETIWFNGMGQAVLRPYRSPSGRAPGYKYADDSESVTLPAANDMIDFYGVPNRWIAIVSEPEMEPLTSVYTNTSASSPTSTVSRGRTIARILENAKAVDQTTLDAYVARMAMEDSQVYRKVTFETALMPHHEHMDVLDLSLKSLGLVGSFQETGWEMDLVPGGKMKHETRLMVFV